jgi:hypothetical protein
MYKQNKIIGGEMPEPKRKTTPKQKKTTTSKTTSKSKPTAKKTQKKTASKSKAQEQPTAKKQRVEEENLGDKFSTMAEKVFESMKIGVQKLSDFASDSSQVAKIKFEILNLNSDRKSLLREVGQKLWKLHKTKSLQNI